MSPRFFCAALALFFAVASPARAQRRIAYDTLTAMTPGAVSCGFCANERFGVVFRPLDSGGGLRPSDFPLTLDSIEVAVARAVVTGDFISGYMCMGSTVGGAVAMQVEAYAGTTAPRTSIMSFPGTGPWPGETMLFMQSVDLTVSTETAAGSGMYDVMVNTVAMSPAIRIDPPNTYVRVAVTIPSGGMSSSCTDLGLPEPAAVALRDDDGRIENNTSFIYSVGGVGTGWLWNEDMSIVDPATFQTGIRGDWLVRLNVSSVAGPTDAGTTPTDAGTAPTDAGTTPTDGGSSASCTMDSQCAGGERCVSGRCQRLSCTAATDCAGGMTCVEGRCRNLCTSNAECVGGEVCDMAAGYCVAAGSMRGGCGCRIAGGSAPSGVAFLALAALGLSVWRRRRG